MNVHWFKYLFTLHSHVAYKGSLPHVLYIDNVNIAMSNGMFASVLVSLCKPCLRLLLDGSDAFVV